MRAMIEVICMGIDRHEDVCLLRGHVERQGVLLLRWGISTRCQRRQIHTPQLPYSLTKAGLTARRKIEPEQLGALRAVFRPYYWVSKEQKEIGMRDISKQLAHLLAVVKTVKVDLRMRSEQSIVLQLCHFSRVKSIFVFFFTRASRAQHFKPLLVPEIMH